MHSAPASQPDSVSHSAAATPARPQDSRPILFYNDQCAVCRTLAGWVMRSDEPRRGGKQLIDERPIGADPAALRAVAPQLDIWEAYANVHLLMPDGSMKVGGEAIAELLRRLPQTRWFAGLFNLGIGGVRPFQAALNTAYYLLDRIRPALGCESCGTPVPWWGKPIEWVAKAVKGVAALVRGS